MSVLNENDLLTLGAMYELNCVCGENNARAIQLTQTMKRMRIEVKLVTVVMVSARAVCLVELLWKWMRSHGLDEKCGLCTCLCVKLWANAKRRSIRM